MPQKFSTQQDAQNKSNSILDDNNNATEHEDQETHKIISETNVC